MYTSFFPLFCSTDGFYPSLVRITKLVDFSSHFYFYHLRTKRVQKVKRGGILVSRPHLPDKILIYFRYKNQFPLIVYLTLEQSKDFEVHQFNLILIFILVKLVVLLVNFLRKVNLNVVKFTFLLH